MTILFPIKTVLSILLCLSWMERTREARLSPSSASVRIRMRLTVVNAVSAEEKKPDKNNRTIRIQICMTPVVSNISSLLEKN